MTEQKTDLQNPRVLRQVSEHLADRYAGVFFPELVERCVAESYAGLARQARIPTYLAPMALHGAADRLRALAREQRRPVCQVLFVDDHDTGPAAVAAALLAEHARAAVVARSAGISPGTTLDQHAVRLLAEHGADPAAATPKPLTDPILAAADWVIVLGTHELGPIEEGTHCQSWPAQDLLGTAQDTDGGTGVTAELETRVQALWLEITAGAGSEPVREQA
ncbi:three-helix bundle dimerization domain-containing protein [Kocuria rosea]|uniref:Arsenate reductase ArsC n=1 Tax=Kocuria rosea TaxID=1275 RepID=A0A4R5YMJ2_KOCRO|nr:arsenate reductase ArsC [Kocuria rosea]TDL46536.1 arsenate reductase ArsC [Kocuria rosea]